MGDFEKSLPAFILVALLSFLVGFLFMVLLRFLIKPCVWLLPQGRHSTSPVARCSVFLVLLMLAVGGGLCWVRSKQCAGLTLLD